MTRICVAGATGWVGQSLVPAILAAPDLELVGAVARQAAGTPLGPALGIPDLPLVISATVAEALAPNRGAKADVFIDYTSPTSVKANVLTAIESGVHAVIGTSGLDEAAYGEIDEAAKRHGVGVLAAGNFAISAVLLQYFALLAAKYMPSWEVIDYAGAGKPDAPSGTARELAHRLAAAGAPELQVPIAETLGAPVARGLTLDGTQVHSIRLPGYVLGVEALFGKADERLSIRHDAGSGAALYVGGTLLAARRVSSFAGLRRGLNCLLDLS